MDEIDELVKDFRESMEKNNIEFDEEAEIELRKLLTNFRSSIDDRDKIKNLIRFIIRQMIVRPIVKKVMADIKSGKLTLSGD